MKHSLGLQWGPAAGAKPLDPPTPWGHLACGMCFLPLLLSSPTPLSFPIKRGGPPLLRTAPWSGWDWKND